MYTFRIRIKHPNCLFQYVRIKILLHFTVWSIVRRINKVSLLCEISMTHSVHLKRVPRCYSKCRFSSVSLSILSNTANCNFSVSMCYTSHSSANFKRKQLFQQCQMLFDFQTRLNNVFFCHRCSIFNENNIELSKVKLELNAWNEYASNTGEKIIASRNLIWLREAHK